jgi:hypothetical protein
MATMMLPVTGFEIRKLPDGGYVVGDVRRFDGGYSDPFLFACTNISDALAYIKKKLEASPPK